MSRNSKIIIAATLALAIASCASQKEQQSNNSPTLTNNALVQTKEPTKQQFNNPVVPTKEPQQVAQATPSLIRLTNATERINFLSKGRNDPFAQIVGQNSSQMPNDNAKVRLVPLLPPLPAVTPVATIVKKRSAVISARLQRPNLNPVLPRVLPPVVPNQTLAPVLPASPQPELAKAVFVSGVILVGSQPQAIIKVPNEPTSRYVQAGQRLANGVLIKRIEMNEGSEPIIILEQYGIEVAKMVGETPANTPPAATTTATVNPVSVASPAKNSVSVGSS